MNQELFQLWMCEKEMVSELGMHLSRYLQILLASFAECFLPDHIAKLKCDCFYDWLSEQFKVMVAYLKAIGNEKMNSDYLQVAWEAEKEQAMEASHNLPKPSTSRPKVMSFFPLQKLKGNKPVITPSTQVVHLEEESADEEKYDNGNDLDDIKGIIKEFIVCLTRAVKDA